MFIFVIENAKKSLIFSQKMANLLQLLGSLLSTPFYGVSQLVCFFFANFCLHSVNMAEKGFVGLAPVAAGKKNLTFFFKPSSKYFITPPNWHGWLLPCLKLFINSL